MSFEKTLDDNVKARLDQLYNLFAGVDEDSVPQLCQIVDGALKVHSGLVLPRWDNLACTVYAATNNIHVITFKLDVVTVATITLTYQNGGAADNDTIATLVVATP